MAIGARLKARGRCRDQWRANEKMEKFESKGFSNEKRGRKEAGMKIGIGRT